MTFIKHISCKAPENIYAQSDLMDFFESMGNFADSDSKKYSFFKALRRNKSIKARRSCLPAEYFSGGSTFLEMSTGQRQELYEIYSEKLINEISAEYQKIIGEKEIDNIITVTLTGHHTPGLDFSLLKSLNIKNSPARYNIGAMGCHAGISGLRLANELKGKTLFLCLELCTLHIKTPDNFSVMITNFLFGDGASLIYLEQESTEKDDWKLISFDSLLIPETADKMQFLFREKGIDSNFSPEVSKLIEENTKNFIESWLHKNSLSIEDIQGWAVHPGSAPILDSIKSSLNLSEEALKLSYKILNEYGNMSSPSIYFVLKELLETKNFENQDKIVMITLGPGLTMEAALIEKS